MRLNGELINFAQEQIKSETLTIDMDATLAETHKRLALYCYKKFKSFQPFNAYSAEHGILLHSEFRDGNVNAGMDQLRILQTILETVPESIKTIMMRSDSAGYQIELLEYCAKGANERFGVIEFAVSCNVTAAFKKAALEVPEDRWETIYKTNEKGIKYATDQEYTEVSYVPSWAGKSKKQPDYRFVATREAMKEKPLKDKKETKSSNEDADLPFQTLKMKEKKYKLFGIVTNRKIGGNELIEWFRKRCGHSEKVHSVEKRELTGGKFPSGKFGANAVWWQIMVLSFNINALMKKLILPESLKTRALKGLREELIRTTGQLVFHAGRYVLKLSGGDTVFELFEFIRGRLKALGNAYERVWLYG